MAAHLHFGPNPDILPFLAGMAELVDAPDSKFGDGDIVRVRFSLPAPM